MLFWIFFFMNFLLGSFVNSTICACDEKDYLLVGLLRIDAKKYFLLKIFKSQITQIIYYTDNILHGIYERGTAYHI